MKRKGILTLVLVFLTACNFPLTRKITPTPNVTQAYETVMAQIQTMEAAGTQVTAVGTPQPLPTQPIPTFGLPTSNQNTKAPLPTVAPTQVCDRVLPGNPIDVTIPDDSVIPAGSIITKTWRLENGGGCTWTRDYNVVWVAGELMTESKTYRIPQEVPPGRSVDISLDMTAPSAVGSYQSYWMLQNADGYYFGIGPSGKSPFWIKIQVQVAQTSTPASTPTLTPPPGHAVLFSGIVTISSTQSMDITSGAIANGDNLDLAFTGNHLKPGSSASISGSLNSQPNYTTCSSQTFGTSQVQVDSDTLYKYFCVKDNQNNIASVQLLAINQGTDITIETNTWSAN